MCSIQDLTSGSHHIFFENISGENISLNLQSRLRNNKTGQLSNKRENTNRKRYEMNRSSLKLFFEILKGARLLIDLFAKIAVSSILIVCTKTRTPNYFPTFIGHFCLLNQKNVIEFYQTFNHTLFPSNKGILFIFDLFKREKIS